jgi:hypothetical protein
MMVPEWFGHCCKERFLFMFRLHYKLAQIIHFLFEKSNNPPAIYLFSINLHSEAILNIFYCQPCFDLLDFHVCYIMLLEFICSYSLVLRHTTEEVLDACIEAIEPAQAALTSHLRNQVMNDLMECLKKHSWFTGFDIADEQPVRYSLEKWVKLAKEVQATVFIAGIFF